MAGNSIGSIFVDLLLRSSSFDQKLAGSTRNLKTARNQWKQDLNGAGLDFAGFGKQVDAAFVAATRSLTGFGAAIGASISVGKIVQYSDTFRQMESRLSLVTSSSEEMAAVQERLYSIAQRTSQPLAEITNAYVRLNNSLTTTQKGQTDLVRITELLSKTLRISGADAVGAATFFQQFGQAASSDFKAIGQELQTFADQNPIFYKILQDQAREYGKTLKDMASDGELSYEFITAALLRNSAKIEEQNSKIAGTVGQAWQKLDNVLLSYIGTSEQVAQSTSSVAVAINALADNFDLLVKAGVGLAAVFASRLAVAALATAAAFVTVGIRAVEVQVVLRLIAGYSITTATAMGTLAAAARGVGAAMSLVGGPIGLALIALYTSVTLGSNNAAAAQRDYDATVQDITDSMQGYATASQEVQKQMRAENQERLNTLISAREELSVRAQQYAQMSDLRLGMQRLAGYLSFGKIDNPDSIYTRYEAAAKAVERAQEAMKNAEASSIPSLPALDTSKADEKAAAKAAKQAAQEAKKSEQELGQLYQQNRTYILGLDDAAIKYRDTQADLQRLYDAGKISLGEYAAATQRLEKEYSDTLAKNADKNKVWALDMAEISRNASRNIHQVFADFLFDPFEGGLKGMLEGFSNMLRRMVADAAAAQILSGLFGEGGIDIGAAAASGWGSLKTGVTSAFAGYFADGGTIAPGKWGIAGEAGAEIITGGQHGATVIPMNGGGGGGLVVNVINNGNSQVSATSRQGASGMELDILIDQAVASNISTPGSKTNKALGAYNNRNMVRR